MAGPKGKQQKTKDRIAHEGGMGITCVPRLQEIVTRLCGVRRRKPGAIKMLVRTAFEHDKVLAKELRLANEVEE